MWQQRKQLGFIPLLVTLALPFVETALTKGSQADKDRAAKIQQFAQDWQNLPQMKWYSALHSLKDEKQSPLVKLELSTWDAMLSQVQGQDLTSACDAIDRIEANASYSSGDYPNALKKAFDEATAAGLFDTPASSPASSPAQKPVPPKTKSYFWWYFGGGALVVTALMGIVIANRRK